ncbi:hypothetical protein [Mucilaginibacter sp.]|nr:hypothetical protein [Mucilaginibacter sp.]
MLNLFQHPISKVDALQAIMPMQIGMMAFFNFLEHINIILLNKPVA